MRFLTLLLFCFSFLHSHAQTLVLPGDFPDPSVVKIGDRYWATATTSNWAPAFPLLQSKDLLNWQMESHVFEKLPAWSDYYFWAPEISYDNGRVYVYYSAHKRDGNLCVAVASADHPTGPYRDHGTLMCQPAGSIDAFPMRDGNGKLYLIWKEDGNSVKQPTPIWAMEMNEERTALTGEKVELFRNDASWESNLVEGVSMMRHGEYIYAFYAGAGCCGRDCSYAMGVARAKKLLGPWEKFQGNPLFHAEGLWKCPGHGTPVEKDGKYYLLYHGYHAEDDVYVGRQGLLKEFRFSGDGWIELVEADPQPPVLPSKLYDEFTGAALSPQWQWSVFHTPEFRVKKGRLELAAMPGESGTFVAQKIIRSDFQASVRVFPEQSKAEAGLAIVGDEKNLISFSLKGNLLVLWKLRENKLEIIRQQAITAKGPVHFRVVVANGKDIEYFYSINGADFKKFNENALDGAYLPPWDRAIRVALIAKGKSSAKAVFDDFVIENR